MIGQTISHYTIEEQLGRGGMGVVYEAEQQSLQRMVAVKVFPRKTLRDSRQLNRFHREARTAGRLHHTNIVPVFGVGQQDGMHYYVMQRIAGTSLDLVMDDERNSGSLSVIGHDGQRVRWSRSPHEHHGPDRVG